jgi:hypothetical protein
MAKRYSQASGDVTDRIVQLREKHHAELKDVTIDGLFIFDDESSDPVLMHQGYPAAGLARIVPLRDRAAGLSDCQIIVDRATWQGLAGEQKNALIDHELNHFEPAIDKHGKRKFDALDRPKMRIRKHDWQLGWFDCIAERHGEASLEVMTARQLVAESGQLYFDFVSFTTTPAASRKSRTSETRAPH